MRRGELLDQIRSICTHPAFRGKNPTSVRPFYLAAIRIISPTHPISCGYSVTYTRDLAAFLRDASGAMRDDMRADSAHPARPLGKNAKKTPPKGPKGPQRSRKYGKNR